MPAPLFTVINTFTLKDPAGAEDFERRFLDHVRWMRAQEGFRAHQAVRATERPEVYVNLGWWAAPDLFKRVMASETFQEHAKEFHRVVDVEADPSLGVLRIDAEGGKPAGGDLVVLIERFTVTGDAQAFEAAYRAYAEASARRDGFGHTDLAKSVVRPGGYTAATRWSGPVAYRAAQDTPEYAAVLKLAEVETVAATPVAGNRALEVTRHG
ncbi:antibiotic biosynthesis monooxygenase [Streptomyces sp. NBC_00893]|uniref:antibiotic biosynthesis monooxygenase family protein n=1 Tax=Streptomyces sp. NBC_00893 TaxID=2975862 RepID=UPI00224EF785|nr:antibiotic biosynthesis monooxygenase family protein [Streptomyces sp. NBC_00893]MCX4851921.1 antibiotic biosynthesis monooxygenase [Streptomyces sp. NBC_00893]